MKGISKVVWIVMAFLLAVAVAFGLGYWYFVMLGKTGGMMTKQQCDLTFMTSCKEYEGNGFPGTMHIKTYCEEIASGEYEPAACCGGATSEGWFEDNLSVPGHTWWDCIAPGCRVQYGMEIDSEEDCGGHA